MHSITTIGFNENTNCNHLLCYMRCVKYLILFFVLTQTITGINTMLHIYECSRDEDKWNDNIIMIALYFIIVLVMLFKSSKFSTHTSQCRSFKNKINKTKFTKDFFRHSLLLFSLILQNCSLDYIRRLFKNYYYW